MSSACFVNIASEASYVYILSVPRWRFQLAPFVSKQSNKYRHLAVKIEMSTIFQNLLGTQISIQAL